MWQFVLDLLMNEATKDAGGKNSAGGMGIGMLSKNMGGNSTVGGSVLSKEGEQFNPNDTEFTRKRDALMSKGMTY